MRYASSTVLYERTSTHAHFLLQGTLRPLCPQPQLGCQLKLTNRHQTVTSYSMLCYCNREFRIN
jgi:hypothetical protein